jgi:hypothetical protein
MKKNKSLIIGIIVATLLFVLIYSGMMYVADRDVSDNILAYAGVSLVIGLVTAAFYHYNLKYAFYIFLIGILVGIFEMFRNFMTEQNGWEDLAGIVSIMFWTVAGFFAGLIVQGVVYLYKRNKK